MDWTLESYFPAFDGAEFRKFKTELDAAIASLHDRIEAQEDGLEPASFAGWQAIVVAYEEIERRLSHIGSYLGCLSSADAANESYRRESASLAHVWAECRKVWVPLIRRLGDARRDHFEAFLKRDALADAVPGLRRWRDHARHLMSTEEEALAAELEVDGLNAWSRLYDNLTGTLEFSLQRPDGTVETVPMSRRRSLMAHPDRAVRAAAFHGGNAAWTTVETSCAAAINAIAGSRLTLQHRRNHEHFLEPALIAARLERASLDALFEALHARAAVTREMLRRKAARLGRPAIAWFDLEAPTPGATATDAPPLTWSEGSAQVAAAFDRAYPALGSYLREMIDRRWIEFSPRRGKRPGAFCTHSLLTGETRIYMTFDGTINDTVTLAHEAGHAWHAHLLRKARPLAQEVPMTLAESASTFGEMLLIDGLLENPDTPAAVKIELLDSQVRQAGGFLLDVPMRYEFERRFHEERASGEVPVSRLKQLMAEAQQKFFGDSLAPGEEDPMFWASKLHFYIAGVSFYNFPYTVGFLLSRALFARFKSEGASFLPTYENFLQRSGVASCEELARELLDADLGNARFWADLIDGVAPAGEKLEALLPPPPVSA